MKLPHVYNITSLTLVVIYRIKSTIKDFATMPAVTHPENFCLELSVVSKLFEVFQLLQAVGPLVADSITDSLGETLVDE